MRLRGGDSPLWAALHWVGRGLILCQYGSQDFALSRKRFDSLYSFSLLANM